MKNLLLKAKETNNLNKDEIVSLLSNNNEKTSNEIFELANQVRKKHVGDEVYLRALIEFSNTCSQNCFYCGLRCANKNIERYNLSENDILQCVQNAIDLGYQTIVLQSGENQAYPTEKMVKLIKEIKKHNVALTLSIGEKTYEEYKAYKNAGADRYLLRIETTNAELYHQMHPNTTFKNRINCLKNLKSLGYELGTGSLIGLPNQSIDSLADDILFFKEIGADMIGVGPFIPHPQTPLSNTKNGSFELACKMMALTRIILPEINIPATTAMETLQTDGQKLALQRGANVVMVNLTAKTVKKEYDIYPNKTSANPYSIKENLLSIGRTIEMNRGNSLKWVKEKQKRNNL